MSHAIVYVTIVYCLLCQCDVSAGATASRLGCPSTGSQLRSDCLNVGETPVLTGTQQKIILHSKQASKLLVSCIGVWSELWPVKWCATSDTGSFSGVATGHRPGQHASMAGQ